MIKEQIRQQFTTAIMSLVSDGKLTKASIDMLPFMSIQRSKDANFGDFSANIAMLLAKPEKKAPRDIAIMLQHELKTKGNVFDTIDVAGPGFINLMLSYGSLSQIIPHIANKGTAYGRTRVESPKKALVEFVSANPTGGLHLGHARGAFVGDALARLLDAAGFLVTREFYVNDTGNQIEILARTIYKRYCELFGDTVVIEKGEYPGDYVKDIARALKDLHGDRWLHTEEEKWLLPLARFGVDYNLALIRRSLHAADIDMDEWYYEHNLHESGKLEDLLEMYQQRHMLYEADCAVNANDKIRRKESKAAKFTHMQEGGTFLKTAQFGDDEDRIVRRKDTRFVYLTADLAYHHYKFARGFDIMINVFGADHAGHIGRIKAGMAALGHDLKKLSFVVVQMVRLIKGGREVKFSKRTGELVSLDDLIELVGKDVARFVFLMRSSNAQFDLDLDQVMSKSIDNPVFYVQYGHARMATILAKAKAEHGIEIDATCFDQKQQEMLTLPEERDLILRIGELSEVVKEAAEAREPHRVIFYCHELIKIFHSYFTKYRHTEKIISDDEFKTRARLAMVFAIKLTIFNALSFLGISAPEYMELNQEHDGEEIDV